MAPTYVLGIKLNGGDQGAFRALCRVEHISCTFSLSSTRCTNYWVVFQETLHHEIYAVDIAVVVDTAHDRTSLRKGNRAGRLAFAITNDSEVLETLSMHSQALLKLPRRFNLLLDGAQRAHVIRSRE